MINSLSKDSHMTQSFCYSINSGNSQSDYHSSKYKSQRSVYFGALENSSVGKSVNRPVEISFNGLPVSEVASIGKKELTRFEKLLKHKYFKDFLLYADKSQVTFGAAFALILTGLLRPVAIMLTPSSKKNIDDKKYAAAQSISSGLIGLGFAVLFSNPISAAVGKIFDEDKNVPDKYRISDFIKNEESFNLFGQDETKAKKAAKIALTEAEKAKASATNLAKDTFKQIGDLIPAIPKAIFTIAIIPIILKTVFGLEKHKHKNKAEQSAHDNLTLNFQSSTTPQKKVFNNFAGGVK